MFHLVKAYADPELDVDWYTRLLLRSLPILVRFKS